MTEPGQIRLDQLMAMRGLSRSRAQAQHAIESGAVTVNGMPIMAPGRRVPIDSSVSVTTAGPICVSRGGMKLQHALDTFAIAVQGRLCSDWGASTGGFTECLLRNGATRVVAFDVGHDQLAPVLLADSRVEARDRVNLRYLDHGWDGMFDLIVMDLSFISLRLILPVAMRCLNPGGELIALVKPQFEVGRQRLVRSGIVRDPDEHLRVLREHHDWVRAAGLGLRGVSPSPIRGGSGNIEFLAWAIQGAEPAVIDLAAVVDRAHED